MPNVAIPDIPPTTPEMRQYLQALKVAVQNIGASIDALSQQVTGTAPDGTVDLTPPAAPINLAAVSASGGVSLTWTNPGDADLILVEVWESDSTTRPDPNTDTDKRVGTVYAVPGQTGTFNRVGVTTGAHLYYWVRAVDTSGNISDFNDTAGVDVYVTAGDGDGVAPSAPTSVSATAGFRDIWVSWTNPSDTDLDKVIVYENTVNNSATATIVGMTPSGPSVPTSFDRAGLPNNELRYYWLKAADKDGNLSAFSSVVSATTATIDPVDLGTTVGFSAPTAPTVASVLSTNGDGMQVVNVTVNWTAISDTSLSFYEVSVAEAGGSAVVFTTNVNFLQLRGRGAVTYDVKVRGVDRNGNRTAYSSTVSITSATPTITPAVAVNAGSTKIDPGMVLISGASTLASWQQGGDLTKIAGGAISANTVAANAVTVGLRGLDIVGIPFEPNSASQGSGTITTDSVAWGTGSLNYVDDTGTPAVKSISAGTVAYTGTAQIVYWAKGATTLSTTTSTATAYGANNVVMAIYNGGSVLNVTYGRTIIDGNSIQTGSINADRIAAGTITTDRMSAGTINGDRITGGTIAADKIVAGSIDVTQLAIGGVDVTNMATGAASALAVQTLGSSTALVSGTAITAATGTYSVHTGSKVKIDVRVQIQENSGTSPAVIVVELFHAGSGGSDVLVDSAAFHVDTGALDERTVSMLDVSAAGLAQPVTYTTKVTLASGAGASTSADMTRQINTISEFKMAG